MSKFEGRAGEMRDSIWLASEDIDGLGDVRVEVEEVRQHKDPTFEGGRSKPVAYTLAFTGKGRELVLNATNRKSMVKMFGADVKNWVGKTITLYVQDGIRLGKTKTKGIRIRLEDDNVTIS